MYAVPDDVRRLLESQELADFSDVCDFSDYSLSSAMLSEIMADSDCIDYDDDPERSDNYGEDAGLEVALEQCPFDFDELADNMIDSGPEF